MHKKNKLYKLICIPFIKKNDNNELNASILNIKFANFLLSFGLPLFYYYVWHSTTSSTNFLINSLGIILLILFFLSICAICIAFFKITSIIKINTNKNNITKCYKKNLLIGKWFIMIFCIFFLLFLLPLSLLGVYESICAGILIAALFQFSAWWLSIINKENFKIINFKIWINNHKQLIKNYFILNNGKKSVQVIKNIKFINSLVILCIPFLGYYIVHSKSNPATFLTTFSWIISLLIFILIFCIIIQTFITNNFNNKNNFNEDLSVWIWLIIMAYFFSMMVLIWIPSFSLFIMMLCPFFNLWLNWIKKNILWSKL